MKIYFTASIVGKKHYLKNYLKIVEHLRKGGHKVKSDHIIKTSENQINMQSKHDREIFHKNLKDSIMESDCMVVETSFPSISVGFEISLALNMNKPVLLLYVKEAPTLLSDYNNEKLICEKYTSANISSILEDFLHYCSGKSERRFTFFIDPKTADFLNNISKKKQMPKSVYIRRLIRKEMQGRSQ